MSAQIIPFPRAPEYPPYWTEDDRFCYRGLVLTGMEPDYAKRVMELKVQVFMDIPGETAIQRDARIKQYWLVRAD